MVNCTLCNDLCKRREGHAELRFDFTLTELAHSALENRCESCIVLHEALLQAKTPGRRMIGPKASTVHVRCHGEQKGRAETLQLAVTFINNEVPPLNLELYSLSTQAWKSILPRSIIASNPLTTRGVAWARAQLDDCARSHASCNQRGTKRLPHRLLALTRTAKGDIKVKLVELRLSFCHEYSALSHCWGQERGLVTTRKTVKNRKEDIGWLSIPATFQDAIKLSMRLGVNFIWIDSLCILQDDQTDWQIESAKMADIYQHALFTLAATTSPGTSHGAYSRKSLLPKHTEVRFSDQALTCRIGVRERVRHWNKTTSNDATQFPLLSRGWVLQERTLSTRVLHCCDTELIWECREKTTCECGDLDSDKSPAAVFYEFTKKFERQGTQRNRLAVVEDLPSLWDRLKTKSQSTSSTLRKSWLGSVLSLHDDVSSAKPAIPTSVSVPELTRETSPAAGRVEEVPEFIDHYHRLVEHYSSLQLTRADDRLPAFSGLSERMQYYRGDYVVGLWSDSLCFDLMWRIDRHALWDARKTRPKDPHARSWSWASAVAPVQYWKDTMNYKDTVQHVLRGLAPDSSAPKSTPLILNRAKIKSDIHIPGQNPFGAVESGSLVVEASAATATLRIILPGIATYMHLTRNSPTWETTTDHRTSYSVELDFVTTAYGASVHLPFYADYMLNWTGPHRLGEGAEVTLLLVHPDVALVLRQKVRRGLYVFVDGEPVWERIGIARVSEMPEEYGLVDWMQHGSVRSFTIV